MGWSHHRPHQGTDTTPAHCCRILRMWPANKTDGTRGTFGPTGPEVSQSSKVPSSGWFRDPWDNIFRGKKGLKNRPQSHHWKPNYSSGRNFSKSFEMHRGSHPSPWEGSSSDLQGTASLGWILSQGLWFRSGCGSETSCFMALHVGLGKKSLSFQKRALNCRTRFSGSQISILLSHLWTSVSKQLPDISQMTILGKGKSCPRNACLLCADCKGSLDEHRWRSLVFGQVNHTPTDSGFQNFHPPIQARKLLYWLKLFTMETVHGYLGNHWLISLTALFHWGMSEHFFFSPHFILVSWGSSLLSLEDNSIDEEILDLFSFSSSLMEYLGRFLEMMCLLLKIFDVQWKFTLTYLINFLN